MFHHYTFCQLFVDISHVRVTEAVVNFHQFSPVFTSFYQFLPVTGSFFLRLSFICVRMRLKLSLLSTCCYSCGETGFTLNCFSTFSQWSHRGVTSEQENPLLAEGKGGWGGVYTLRKAPQSQAIKHQYGFLLPLFRFFYYYYYFLIWGHHSGFLLTSCCSSPTVLGFED